ncbi:hypothetical protein KCV07_g350, partial [Aureobasidium melanogenum]
MACNGLLSVETLFLTKLSPLNGHYPILYSIVYLYRCTYYIPLAHGKGGNTIHPVRIWNFVRGRKHAGEQSLYFVRSVVVDMIAILEILVVVEVEVRSGMVRVGDSTSTMSEICKFWLSLCGLCNSNRYGKDKTVVIAMGKEKEEERPLDKLQKLHPENAVL